MTSLPDETCGLERRMFGAAAGEIPSGCAAGYMPELNVLCGSADASSESGQPVTTHLFVDFTPARPNGAAA
jgi:hypothetical protein